MELIAEASPRRTARLGGLFWLLTFLTGAFALTVGSRFLVRGDAAATAARILADEPLFRSTIAANLVSGACYVAATLFVYELLKAVSPRVSLLAAFFSLVGCAAGAVGTGLQLVPLVLLDGTQQAGAFGAEQTEALAFLAMRGSTQVASAGFLFFGLHCLLVGSLILRSTFLPRAVGVLMAVGGAGWLTFCLAGLLSPPLAGRLNPYIMLPGTLGELVLTLWLLIVGANVERWHAQARTTSADGRA